MNKLNNKCIQCKYLTKKNNKWIRYSCPYAPNKEYWGDVRECELNEFCGHFEIKKNEEK